MRTEVAPVGARIVDSLPFSIGGTLGNAQALKQEGVQGVALYLGQAKPAQVKACSDAGLGVFGVTFGGAYDGNAAVKQAQALALPMGCCIFLDHEGPATAKAPAAESIGKITAWAAAVRQAGYVPGLYVGVPQNLTSDELWGLPVVRYWRGQGSVRDRMGALAEPSHRGWCMVQAYPSVMCGGVLVDYDMAGHDYLGGTVTWAVP